MLRDFESDSGMDDSYQKPKSTQITPSELATPPEASHQGRICPDEVTVDMFTYVKFCAGE